MTTGDPRPTRLRTLIVDDEQPARERLRGLLSTLPEIDIIGEAEDGEQAIERILDLRPDLVLLDIQMPGCTGLEVAASLPTPAPRIVFCTAYDQYAVDAFELRASDYLLKPVSRARLEKALEHIRGPGRARAGAGATAAALALPYPTRFLAKHGGIYHVIPQGDVILFGSEGSLTTVQTPSQRYWMQPTLAELEARLDPVSFCRISRAAIVNLEAVRGILPLPGGHGKVRMRDGSELVVSRRRLRALLERLSIS